MDVLLVVTSGMKKGNEGQSSLPPSTQGKAKGPPAMEQRALTKGRSVDGATLEALVPGTGEWVQMEQWLVKEEETRALTEVEKTWQNEARRRSFGAGKVLTRSPELGRSASSVTEPSASSGGCMTEEADRHSSGGMDVRRTSAIPVGAGLPCFISETPGKDPVVLTSAGGRRISIRTVSSPPRAGSLDRCKKRVRSEIEEEEADESPLLEALKNIEGHMSTLDTLARMNDEKGMRATVQNLKFELTYAIEQYRKSGVKCNSCKGVVGPMMIDTATQVQGSGGSERFSLEEIKSQLEKGVEEDQLPRLLGQRWPDEVFQAIKEGTESPLEKRTSDVAVVFDLAKTAPLFKKKLYRCAPNVKEMEAAGKLANGQLLVDGHSAKDLFGELQEQERRIYTIVVDSKDESRTLAEILKAVRRLSEFKGVNYVVGDDRLGQLVKRILEYQMRRTGVEAFLTLDKTMREQGAKSAQSKQIPSTAVVVKAEGRTFADLLKDMKTRINKDDTGDILSVRKGPNEEIQLRLRAGKGVEEIKKVISDRVEGAVVKEIRRGPQKVPFHIKDLDYQATVDEVKEGLKEVIGEEDVRVGELRPAYGGTQSVTVLVPLAAAAKLRKVSRLHVGWVCCRVIPREDEVRCYRCWEYGHVSSACKGADRSKLCFNCGREGHIRANCSHDLRCVVCGEEGHRLGSRLCQYKR